MAPLLLARGMLFHALVYMSSRFFAHLFALIHKRKQIMNNVCLYYP